MPSETEEQVVAAARLVISRGAKAVLVTLAERGAVLVQADGTVLTQPPLPVPGGAVVDGTAAGDAFRAGFAVALVEGRPLQECLRFAAAAGAVAVSRAGAVPSLPTRHDVERLLALAAGEPAPELPPQPPQQEEEDQEYEDDDGEEQQQQGPPEGSCGSGPGASCAPISVPLKCPLDFAARLNSMRARRDLLSPEDEASEDTPVGWIQRQARVQGLTMADLNYPQHLEGVDMKRLAGALRWAGLQPGAVATRFPPEFREGAFTNPSAKLRREALELARRACRAAARLGADEVVVWPQYDGYDYHLQVGRAALPACSCVCVCVRQPGGPRLARCCCRPARLLPAGLAGAPPAERNSASCRRRRRRRRAQPARARAAQVDYQTAWRRTVEAFRNLSDSCPPGMKVSLEFKPTDGAARFSIVPNTAAALLLAREVDRPNFGLTWVARWAARWAVACARSAVQCVRAARCRCCCRAARRGRALTRAPRPLPRARSLDFGHMVQAGENPAQSVAMAAAEGRLFGLHLNDVHPRLGGEDGLAFGTVNKLAALELVRWVQKAGYEGHVYFDTFPHNENPVQEAEYNIRRFQALWEQAARLSRRLDVLASQRDTLGLLELLEVVDSGRLPPA
jgi:sugar phosphate isomerase/epimerase